MSKTYSPTLNTIHCSSSCELLEGRYGSIHISGSARLQKNVYTTDLHVSGSCHGDNLMARTVSVSGSLHVHGHLITEKGRVSGSAHIRGAVWGEDMRASGSLHVAEAWLENELHTSGSLHAEGDVKANKIHISGSLNAKNAFAEIVELSEFSSHRCDAIYAKEVRQSSNSAQGVINSMFGFNMQKKRTSKCGLIQARSVELRGMYAGLVRAKEAIIGPGCKIERLEAERYTIDSDAEVGEVVKGTATFETCEPIWKYERPDWRKAFDTELTLPEILEEQNDEASSDTSADELVKVSIKVSAKTSPEAATPVVENETKTEPIGAKKLHNIDVSGVGTVWDGEYNHISVNGMGRVHGKITAHSCDINGTARGDGELTFGRCVVNGMCSLKGTLKTEKLENNGRLKTESLICTGTTKSEGSLYISKNAKCNDVDAAGWMTVLGDLEAKKIEAGPAITVKNLLSADDIRIDCKMYGGAREVVGETIVIGWIDHKMNFSTGSVTRALFNARQAMRGYKSEIFLADSIEGGTLTLDHVQARVVRGHDVTIGDGCEIENVEYSGTLTLSPNAKVKNSAKV